MRPTGAHIDWPWPFKLISRRLTSYTWRPPIKLFGNAKLHEILVARTANRDMVGLTPEDLRILMNTPDIDLSSQQLSIKALPWKLYEYCKPIPDQGEWHVSWPLGLFWRGKGVDYLRIAPFGRWDDLAFYYDFPSITYKRYK